MIIKKNMPRPQCVRRTLDLVAAASSENLGACHGVKKGHSSYVLGGSGVTHVIHMAHMIDNKEKEDVSTPTRPR